MRNKTNHSFVFLVVFFASILLASSPCNAEPASALPKPAWRMSDSANERSELVGDTSSSPFVMLKGLAVCLGLFLIGVFVVKRTQRGALLNRTTRSIRILERIALTSKSSLVRVSLSGREVVLAVGSDRVQVVQEDLALSGLTDLGLVEPVPIKAVG